MARSILLFFHIFIYLSLAVSSFADNATVSVRGEAELKVPADRAVFSLAVVSEADTSSRAMQANSDQLEKALISLRKAGLDEKEISTGQFTINPRWSSRPRQLPEGWRPEIVGFTVTNRLQVKTLKLELVGKFLGDAIKAGINEVQGLQFDLADPRPHRQEAIRMATIRAQQDARVLADATGSVLGEIVTLSLDDARPAPVVARRAFMAEASLSSVTPPVLPGDVTIRASVTAVYELRNVND